MKLYKKILLIVGICIAVIGITLVCIFVIPASCKDKKKPDNPDGDSGAYVYRVSLQNETGFGFANATVKLMKGDEVVATKKTNRAGNANFQEEDIEEGKYKIVVEDTPAGYAFTDPDRTYETGSKGTATVVSISPTGLLEGAAPSGTSYKLGDIVYDFNVILSDGNTYTLSEVLKEKKLVLLNFWATWCGPCKSEFPAMHNAAIEYKDSVSVIAVSTTDTADGVAEFKQSNGLTQFNMAASGSDNLTAYFNVSSIPHSVMIDRYGVVVFNEIGSMPSVSSFTSKFEMFVGEDYLPTVIGGVTEDETTEEGEEERIKPNVSAPKASDLKAAVTEADFTFRFQEEDVIEGEEGYDEYNWPWLISEDKSYIYASNINVNNSWAILYSTFNAKSGDVVVFDYKVGSEASCDIFYVMLDGNIIAQYSGDHASSWNTSYAYVFRDYEAGAHEISFIFLKDSETMAHEDVVQIKNLRVENVSSLTSSTADVNIFRQAATNPTNDKSATTQFKDYVNVVRSDKDDYYHVGNANGPILYANMMNASVWNENGLWALAYSNYVVGDGMNFKDAIEDYAWEATQVTTVQGYTPVTEDLKYLLDAAVRYTSFGEKFAGKYQDDMEYKDYHANEWLELCVYWEHYGTAPMPQDPMAGITFSAAIEMKAGTTTNHVGNEIHVPYKINPRGFKYKFIPETSGAYSVYSTGDKDTVVFLMDEDRKTQLGYWESKIAAAEDDNNFQFYWYFEEGRTYYMLFTTYLDEVATYNVNIDYIGATHTYKENAATLPYSVNPVTFELFLPNAIDYAYYDDTDNGVDDGYYYHTYLDDEGNTVRGGKIYVDMLNTTAAYFQTSTIYLTASAMKNKPVEERLFYVEKQYIEGIGEVEAYDYTDEIYGLAEAAYLANDEYVPVTKRLYEILQIVIHSANFDPEAIEDSWLLLCYYDKTVGPAQA